MQLSRRALSARRNGKLGGLSTASRYPQEYLKQRASKAGSATRDKYGSEYYRYLRTLNKSLRKSTSNSIQKLKVTAKELKELTSVQLVQQARESVGL